MAADGFAAPRFPRSSKYNPDWLRASVSGGANPLWLAEWLSEAVDLRPGLRVLDLGCGRASSSIFLHREFGVEVWATDLWCSPTENLQRIRDAGVENGVFPIHANARSLPFANGFFDVILSIDSYFYYGTDDQFLSDIARFLKPGGQFAIAQAAMLQELDSGIPEHLQEWWAQDQPWILHSAPWWRRHLERPGILDITVADSLEDGWQYWQAWMTAIAPQNTVELTALEKDQGQHFGYVRVAGRRKPESVLQDPIVSVSTEYTQQPLLRAH
ncbi:MAG TPA: class I SAM-dependent methyltransferase [Caulifigura sp.]|jgi:ubiquinone/menaquinone biosynthesis C-methylase UbiE|nr:class I SAM-dependent methyltransferase [Caulifigura sp.]